MKTCDYHLNTVVTFDETRVDGGECPLCKALRFFDELAECVPLAVVRAPSGKWIISQEGIEEMKE